MRGGTTALLLLVLASGCGVVDPTPLAPDAATESSTADRQRAFRDVVRSGLAASTTAQVRTTVETPKGVLATTGVVDRTTEPLALDLDVRLPGRPVQDSVEIRVVDGMMYVEDAADAIGPAFMAFDLDRPLPDQLQVEVADLDPLALYASLDQALVSVSAATTQEIGGEPLDHYAAVIDPGRLDLFGAARGLPEEVDVSVWVDTEGRLRELTMLLVAGDFADVRISATGWGDPVSIEAPASSRTWKPPRDAA